MRSRRKFVLSFLLALSASSSVFASDWVDDEAVNEFHAPRRPKTVPAWQESDGGGGNNQEEGFNAQVKDHGAGHGIPLPKKKGNVLEGNVSRYDLNSQQNQYPGAAGAPRFGTPVQEPSAVHYPPAKEAIVESKVFKAWLEKNHPELKGTLESQRQTIIEVKGKWDDSGHALRTFGMGCTKVPPDRLSKFDLSKSKILIVDCAGNVPHDALETINKFVSEGGYLLTTDWALEGCLQKAIPGYIEWNGDNTRETRVVDAYIRTEDPGLTMGTVSRAHWKLDKKCQLMRVIRPELVEILAASVQLKTDDTTGKGYLAATFRHKKGRVLHLVGHFDYNSDSAFSNLLPDPAPKIGISLRQAIAANFIAEALGQGDAKASSPVSAESP
ncbi:MAG: hypothetical protein C0507_19110 [Cyanobacteria bacterium PR.3.49]|nr:hypothetical protein [Cyanobacteria bacterium PR.3.49]